MPTSLEFLAALHEVVKPKVYLEVGVQYGRSLGLAHAAEVAIGLDPNPLVPPRGNQVIMSMTSDDYFMSFKDVVTERIDFGYIDGMHLHEYALRDFKNIERHANPSSIVVFDDVLPYSQAIAEREQPPGDWTGDVWKVYYLLTALRPDLTITLVDTWPAGSMVVTDLDPDNWTAWDSRAQWAVDDSVVPQDILTRTEAVSVDVALDLVRGKINQ